MSGADADPAMWPSTPYALVDTTLCPSCFHVLRGATACEHCGLVIADRRAAKLLELGDRIVALEAERQQLIEAIRLVHRMVPESVPAPPPPVAVQVVPVAEMPTADGKPAWWEAADAPPPQNSALVAEPLERSTAVDETRVSEPFERAVTDPAPPPQPPVAASVIARAPRRRLTVPVLLLIVGVSLVGVAAIFFLVLAWNIADIRMRALIIGGVTLATMVAAALLRRWALRATAEAIGALGVILLGLDGWAVHANDLFGAGGMDPVVYAGVAALVIGVVCRIWSVISRLRGPDLAATLALPTGLGLLIAGLLPLESSAAITAGLLGTAAGGLAHALPAPWSAARSGRDTVPERTALMAIGVAALAGAAATTLLLGLESMTVQLVAAAVVIVIGVAYTVLLRSRDDVESLPAARAVGNATGAIAAAFAASLGWQMALQTDLPVFPHLVAPVVAVVVAVALDRWQPRRHALPAPLIAAAAVGVASIVALLAFSVQWAQQAIGGWMLWHTAVFAVPAGSDLEAATFAAIAAVIVAVLLFLAPTLDRPGVREARPVAAAVVVLIGAAGTGIPIVIVGTAIVIAAIALVALARGAKPIGWGSAAGIGALGAFLGGLAMPGLWAVGVGVAVAVPITARVLVRPPQVGAVVLALTPVAVGVVAALIAPSAIGAFGVAVDGRAAFVLLEWVALVALASAVWLRLDDTSRTALAIFSYGPLLVSFAMFAVAPTYEGSVSGVLGEPLLAIVRTAGIVVLLSFVALRRTRIDSRSALGPAALGAAALLAPAAACVAIASLETAHAGEDGRLALVAAAAAVVVVWLGALVPARAYGARPADDTREGADAGATAIPAAQTPAAPVAQPPAAPTVRTAYPTLARRFADLGALAAVVAAVAGGTVPASLRWVMLAVIALGFAGASVTRGWAAPPAAGAAAIPQTRAAGVVLARAGRRLFAWPAFAAGTLALWSWLDVSGSFEIEAYVLPPAVGLLVFALVLIWLRRQVEATIAVVLGFSLGLVLPAIAGMFGTPTRGTVVAIVAAAVTLALAWTPARRVRIPALAGALVAIIAVAIVAVARAVDEPTISWWLLLLVGVSYAAAYGLLQGERGLPHPSAASPTEIRSPRAEEWFAVVIPPLALAIAAVSTIPSLDEPLVVAVALTLLGVLHLVAAGLDRLPLGVATRWTAFAGAVIVAAGAFATGDIDAIELVSLPIAGLLLAGAVLAMWRRSRLDQEWPGYERIPWLAGLALAVVPSIIAEPHDVRAWLVIVGGLLAAIECLVLPVAKARSLKMPSALLLSAGALAMGVRALLDPAIESGEFAAIAAGAGALLVAGAMVWMAGPEERMALPTALAAASVALLLLDVGLHVDGGLTRTTITVIVAGVIGVAGAALLRWPRWAAIGAVLAIGGVAAALLAVAGRYFLLAADANSGVEPDFWAAAGIGIVAAVGIMALRSSTSAVVTTVVGAVFSLSLVLFAVAEALLLGRSDGDELRTILTMTALTGAGIVGVLWRARLGVAFAPTAAALAGIFGLVALTVYAVRPVELVTVAPALGLIFLGARAMRRDSAVRSWPALGPGIALLTVPSLVHDFLFPSVVDDIGSPEMLWRVVGLGVVSLVLVVIGAMRRLQAPLVIGSVVLLVHAVAQLWPWISVAYSAVQWWLWLGIGGALLIFLAARYERRVRQLRAAFTAVTSLR